MEPIVPLNLSSLVSRDGRILVSQTNQNNEVFIEPTYSPRLTNGVAVAVLMVVGLLGNGLVLYIYYFKMPRTVISIFVTVLAMLDLITTLVGVPIDVAFKFTLATVMKEGEVDQGEGGLETLSTFCKLAHFEVYSSSLASGSVLLLIAFTRHSKVCRPLEPGLSKRKASILCALICIGAMILCTITLFINGLEPMKIAVGERDALDTNSSNLFLFGKDATTNDEVVGGVPSDRLKNSTFADHVHVKLTGDNISSAPKRQTEVVYMYICRTNEKQKNTPLYYVLQAVLMTAFVGILLSLLVLHCKISHTLVDFERRRSSMRRFSPQQIEAHTTHITASTFRIFATITLIFAVSYLPHLVCLIVEKALFKPGQTIPQTSRILLDLAYNFPYINVVANPFIYGYRSTVFRQHCLDIVCRFCPCLDIVCRFCPCLRRCCDESTGYYT